MTSIDEIYQKYHIIPHLQLHMLRVTAVGLTIARHIRQQVDEREIVQACLLHDMGNILKFKFDVFPDFFEPEGVAYWEKVKSDFAKTYGPAVHPATIKIANEIGVSLRVIELIDSISFNQEKVNRDGNDFSRKICAYADMRVSPMGISSLEERFEDGLIRYPSTSKRDDSFRYAMNACLRTIEKQLFAECDIVASDITEETVQPLIAELRKVEL